MTLNITEILDSPLSPRKTIRNISRDSKDLNKKALTEEREKSRIKRDRKKPGRLNDFREPENSSSNGELSAWILTFYSK